MKIWKIPACWQMYGFYEIEAESLEDAVSKAEIAPLPEGSYVDGSFEVDHEVIDAYNDKNGTWRDLTS